MAKQVAVAVDNALNYQTVQRYQQALLDFPEGKGLIHEGLQAPIDDSPAWPLRHPNRL